MKRANFIEPTELSAICNIHFSPDCYEESFMVEMGLIKQSPRLSGAVPTIQSPAASKSAGRVLRILFTAQDGSATRTRLDFRRSFVFEIVSKSPTQKVKRNNYLN